MRIHFAFILVALSSIACSMAGGPAVDVGIQGTPGSVLTQEAAASPCTALGAEAVGAIFNATVTITDTAGANRCFFQFEDNSAVSVTINTLADEAAAAENLTNSAGVLGGGEPFSVDGLDEGLWVEQNRTYFGRRGATVVGVSGSGSFTNEGPPLQEKMATLAAALLAS